MGYTIVEPPIVLRGEGSTDGKEGQIVLMMNEDLLLVTPLPRTPQVLAAYLHLRHKRYHRRDGGVDQTLLARRRAK